MLSSIILLSRLNLGRFSCYVRSLESVDEYLEKYGAEITNKLESQQRQPPLYFAVNLSDDETCYNCLVKLLRKGANPLFKDNNEQTIIFYAFRDGTLFNI